MNQTQFQLMDFVEIREDRPKAVAVDSSVLMSPPDASDLICSQWLQNSPGKFEAFQRCYRGLIGGGNPKNRIVDVGGGLHHLTEDLLGSEGYVLIDPLHHLSGGEKELLARIGEQDWLVQEDWARADLRNYDMVIANDLFPNVDYRIGKFLRAVHNSDANQLRVVLTLHHDERELHVKRDETGEPLIVIPLSVREVVRELKTFAPQANLQDFLTRPDHKSGWSNGRYMYFLQFERSPE